MVVQNNCNFYTNFHGGWGGGLNTYRFVIDLESFFQASLVNSYF